MRLDVTTKEVMFLLTTMLALGMDMGEALHSLVVFIQIGGDPSCPVQAPLAFASSIIQLEAALKLPAWIYSAQNVPVSRQEALCMLLRCLAFPRRHDDLVSEFGRSPEVISSIANIVARIIYTAIQRKIEFDHRMFERYKVRSAAAIFAKVGRLSNCLGFIDGTVRRICRPTRHQKQAYSGHKRMHGIKFQSVTIANGLFVSLYGPVEGRRHDGYMLRASAMQSELEKYPEFVIYGDKGYPLRRWLLCPYSGAVLTDEQTQFNLDLSKARVAVEWSFGWIVRDWKFFTHPNSMKLFKSPIGLLHVVAAFLTNCLSCVRRRNQTSNYFRCKLPTLEIYLADLHDEDVDELEYPSDDFEEFSTMNPTCRVSRIVNLVPAAPPVPVIVEVKLGEMTDAANEIREFA